MPQDDGTAKTAPSLGSPSPSTPTSTSSAGSAIPRAITTDLGPLSPRAIAAVAARCRQDLAAGSGTSAVLFARRTLLGGNTVLFTTDAGTSLLCFGSGSLDSPDSRVDVVPAPTDGDAVVRMGGPRVTGSVDGSAARSDASVSYRVGPDVASVQLRITSGDRPGAWYEAAISNGVAFGSATVDATDRSGDPRRGPVVEDRAFDRDGHELMIDRTHG